ncbi:DgyrCDS6819 [Dimorphilus gyrociliatus]|uniref:DgyrCDS6819 n=1 Tax=Dimorphilus gyrociliatus TaxID=2664684 RepID=A0A7I8VP65_9ANNE|nr:DgyrCDS6819 [Dimorphilus gyrociliatus]
MQKNYFIKLILFIGYLYYSCGDVNFLRNKNYLAYRLFSVKGTVSGNRISIKTESRAEVVNLSLTGFSLKSSVVCKSEFVEKRLQTLKDDRIVVKTFVIKNYLKKYPKCDSVRYSISYYYENTDTCGSVEESSIVQPKSINGKCSYNIHAPSKKFVYCEFACIKDLSKIFKYKDSTEETYSELEKSLQILTADQSLSLYTEPEFLDICGFKLMENSRKYKPNVTINYENGQCNIRIEAIGKVIFNLEASLFKFIREKITFQLEYLNEGNIENYELNDKVQKSIIKKYDSNFLRISYNLTYGCRKVPILRRMQYEIDNKNNITEAFCNSPYGEDDGKYKIVCEPFSGLITLSRPIALCRSEHFVKSYGYIQGEKLTWDDIKTLHGHKKSENCIYCSDFSPINIQTCKDDERLNYAAFIHPGYKDEAVKCKEEEDVKYLLEKESISNVKDELDVSLIKLNNSTLENLNLGVMEPLEIQDIDVKVSNYISYNERTKRFIEEACSLKYGLTVEYLCIPKNKRCIQSKNHENFHLIALRPKDGKCYFKLKKLQKLERIEVTFSTVPLKQLHLKLEIVGDQDKKNSNNVGSPLQLQSDEMVLRYPEKYFIWLYNWEAYPFCDLTLSDWMKNYVTLSQIEMNNTCIYNLTTNINYTLQFDVKVRKFNGEDDNKILIEDSNTDNRIFYGNYIKDLSFYVSLSSYYVLSHNLKDYLSIELNNKMDACSWIHGKAHEIYIRFSQDGDSPCKAVLDTGDDDFTVKLSVECRDDRVNLVVRARNSTNITKIEKEEDIYYREYIADHSAVEVEVLNPAGCIITYDAYGCREVQLLQRMKYKKREKNGQNNAECQSYYNEENGDYKFSCSPNSGVINFERNISLCRDIPFEKTYLFKLALLIGCYFLIGMFFITAVVTYNKWKDAVDGEKTEEVNPNTIVLE